MTSYGYDNANRLTDIQNTKSDTSAIATYHFSLNANGNRTGIDRIEPLTILVNSGTTNYAHNAKKNRLLTAGDSSFTYDLEGQLADIDGNSYTFDTQHRLASIGGPTACQYSYDGAGNRLEATRDGVTTRYIYDASGNLLAEADGSNKITRYYIHGLGLLAMVTPSDEVYCYHYNAIGNTIAMTDGSQKVINKYAYTPFGIITNQQEAVPQPFKYVGRHGVMTEPNGLQYMRARYYDPEVGRFISEDPIGFGGGDVNLYVYVGNNPLLFIDPWGLCGQSSFQQGLKDTAKYAGYFATISFFIPGGQTAAIVFAGIGVVATGLEVGLYSENNYIDTAKGIVKQVLPIKKPYNMLTDQAIDISVDMIQNYGNSNTPSPRSSVSD